MFEPNDLFDTFLFRTTTLTGFLFYWLPIICILSPTYLSPFGFVDSTQEFKAYRMVQYDLYGQAYGSRQAFVSSEVRLWSTENLNRKAALIRLEKLTIERFRSLLTKGINSLFIVIPSPTTQWTDEKKSQICDLETILLSESVSIPIYFLPETQQTNDLYKSIESRRDSTKDSALAVLYDMITADGYQLSVTTGKYHQRSDSVLYNIAGKLIGHGIEERLPKILFVAHYDALGLANGLAQGADSNASGVLILLKLIRLFSKLYAKQTTRAKYNLHFLFAAGGKLNYQGSKKWIDDYHDQKQQQQLPNDIDVVVCLGKIVLTKKKIIGNLYYRFIGSIKSTLYACLETTKGNTSSKFIISDTAKLLLVNNNHPPNLNGFEKSQKCFFAVNELLHCDHLAIVNAFLRSRRCSY
jgi:hypothetical protein